MVEVSKYKDLFIVEAEEHLQKLNVHLLALEKTPNDKDILNELMRSSHTLKSSSATMGYSSMAFLMHVMEDIFDEARNNTLTITLGIINELFLTFDAIGASILSIKEAGTEQDLQEKIDTLKLVTNVKTKNKEVGKETNGVTSEAEATGSVAQDSQIKVKEPQNNQNTKQTKSTDPAKNYLGEENIIEEIEHIKVPVKRLDSLFDLVEELLIDKMRLDSMVGDNTELKEVIDHLERLVLDLQYQITQARLVPVDQIFARFPRMVRDLSTSQKKKIDLQISGGDIELDRTIIDKLGNPLVHLIRNAIDHGIDKEGTIKLNVVRERNYALVSVEDDGCGIDHELVREIAVKRKIFSKEEAALLSKEQLTEVLFNPQFSTTDTITEISGRGVGLSVVKEFVNEIGGEVIVESPTQALAQLTDDKSLKNAGTRFVLELPLTIAIANSLLVTVGSQMFAIPFSNIIRAIQIPISDIKSVADREVAIVNDSYVTLIPLDQLFGITDAAIATDSKTLVLIKKGTEIAGIVVDTLKDKQEIIIKPLPDSLKNVPGFSGSTTLGDGRTIMILDIEGLLDDTANLSVEHAGLNPENPLQ